MNQQPRVFDIIDQLPEGSLIRVDDTIYVKREGGYLNDIDDHSPAPIPVLKMTNYRVLSTPNPKGYIFDEERHAMVFVPDTDNITSDFLIPERELAAHWLASVRILTLLANRPGATFCGNFTVTVNPHLKFQSRELNPETPTAPGMIYFDTLANADKAADWMNDHHPLNSET